MRTPRYLPATLAGLAVIGGVTLVTGRSGGYDVTVALESATNIVAGGPVLVDGFTAGTVQDVEVVNGQALVSMTLDDDIAPLHQGAVVAVDWKATLSERQITIQDGSPDAPTIPDGGRIEGDFPRHMELDDILAALDSPARAKLQSLVQQLQPTLAGNEEDLRATLTTGGPALEALGQTLQALGTDGPAIRNLVQRLDAMLGVVAQRDDEVDRIVASFGDMAQAVAARRQELRATLVALPPALRQATDTLGLVPSVVDEAVPLLEALEPATAKLGPVAADLRPVLSDLRPLVADLRPMLGSTEDLLALTPGLLDQADAAVPALGATVSDLREPAAFLRPYTPEVTAFFGLWASAFANYDANGNFARIHGQQGPTSLNENPGVVPPGVTYDPYPLPGAIVSQPWTDAFGSEMR